MIRKLNTGDIEVVMEIWREASIQAHSFLSPEFSNKAESDLQHIYLPATESWVYEIDGIPVGFISMLNNEIGGLFVLPRFQSRGIGQRLVNFVAGQFSELEVEVFAKNTIGRKFYNQYGFKLLNEYFHKESNELVMRLHLQIL